MTIPPPQASPEAQRTFVIHCWNGMEDDINATLALHPEAVHWREPETGGTGLIYAIAHGSHKLNIAELLLAKGADIDARDSKGETALMKAAQNGGFASVEWLLDRSARLEVTDNDGRTAAMWAAERLQKRLATFLDEYAEGLAQRALAEQRERQIATAAQDAKAAHTGISAGLTVKKPLSIRPRR